MKSRVLGMWLGLMLSTLCGREIPVEDFCRAQFVQNVSISPNGKYIGFIKTENDEGTLYFTNLETQKTSRVRHYVGGYPNHVFGYSWLGDQRIRYISSYMYGYITGESAMDLDGGRWVGLGGADELSKLFTVGIVRIFPNQDWMLTEQGKVGSDGTVFADVARTNHITGEYQVIEKNPGNIYSWFADRKGRIRIATVLGDGDVDYLRRGPEDKEWRPWGAKTFRERKWHFLYMDGQEQIWVSFVAANGRVALGKLNPGTLQIETVFENGNYDVIPPWSYNRNRESRLEKLKVSLKDGRVLGVHYQTAKPKAYWFDPVFSEAQKEIDRALPGTINQIDTITLDESKCTVFSFSDREAGSFSIYDLKTRQLYPIARSMPWLDPQEMAPVFPMEFASRDGLTIGCYLTLPVGRPRKGLPLIVMPHGGPYMVRDSWQFDMWAQFFANRGYAVLQVNFRGSNGYGYDFSETGRTQVGKAMQDDITDGAKWVIASGLADAKRVAIVGASYGGYSAVWALGHNPELYKCGIAMLAPVDWANLVKSHKEDDIPFAYRFWLDAFGGGEKAKQGLKEASALPGVKTIASPLLAVYNQRDRNVPFTQWAQLRSALNKHDKVFESLIFEDEGHGFFKEKNRITLLRRMEEFLKKHMPADPEKTPAKPVSGS